MHGGKNKVGVLKMEPRGPESIWPQRPEATKSRGQVPNWFVTDTVQAYGELGLDAKFLAILGKHLIDTKIIWRDDIRTSRVQAAMSGSNGGGLHELRLDRRLEMSQVQLFRYADSMKSMVQRTGVAEDLITLLQGEPAEAAVVSIDRKWTRKKKTPEQLAHAMYRRLAAQWMLYEVTADVAASAVYMQQKYDRYVADLNPITPYIQGEWTIAREFLREFAGVEAFDESDRDMRNLLVAERTSFRAGMALYQLRSDLLRDGIFQSEQRSRWGIADLRANYPGFECSLLPPFDENDLMLRLRELTPRSADTERLTIMPGV